MFNWKICIYIYIYNNDFRRNRFKSQILTIWWILVVRDKHFEVTLLFVDFSKAFDSINKGKMKQILQANCFPKETVASMMRIDKNTKVKVHSPDGDTDLFDMVTGDLQSDNVTPYLFRICQDNVLQTSVNLIKENGFKLNEVRSRRYSARTFTDADYAMT